MTITPAAFSLVASGVIRCAPMPPPPRQFSLLIFQPGNQFHAREMSLKLCPFPSGNVTRREALQHSHHHSQRRAVSSHITIEVHHSRVVLASDVPAQRCRQVNRAQTFWPRIRLRAYVMCIC